MGARYGIQCYSDVQAAATAQCASTAGVSSSGFVSCYAAGLGPDGAGLLYLRSTPSAGAPVEFTALTAYPVCDPLESYRDLSELWAISLAGLVTMYLLKRFVVRPLMPQ